MRDSLNIRHHIFGRESFSTVATTAPPSTHTYTEEAVEKGVNTPITHLNDLGGYEVMLIIFSALYLIYIGRAFANRAGVTMRISNPFAKIVEAEGLGGSLRIGDILLDWVLVVIMMILFSARLIDLLQPYSPMAKRLIGDIAEAGSIIFWMISVGIAFVASLFYGILNISMMSTLLRRRGLFRQFTLIKSRLLHIAVVWIFPTLLISSMEHENLWFSYLAMVQAVAFICIYLFRCLALFISQKISILHWILYLCAVELLPLTFWWAFFVR